MSNDNATPWSPPVDAPRSQAGDLIHTCNDGNLAGLPFGRLAEPGTCARCDERRYTGAPARPRFGGRKTRARLDQEMVEDIRGHFKTTKHRNGECGIVCTFGQW